MKGRLSDIETISVWRLSERNNARGEEKTGSGRIFPTNLTELCRTHFFGKAYAARQRLRPTALASRAALVADGGDRWIQLSPDAVNLRTTTEVRILMRRAIAVVDVLERRPGGDRAVEGAAVILTGTADDIRARARAIFDVAVGAAFAVTVAVPGCTQVGNASIVTDAAAFTAIDAKAPLRCEAYVAMSEAAVEIAVVDAVSGEPLDGASSRVTHVSCVAPGDAPAFLVNRIAWQRTAMVLKVRELVCE